MSFRYPLNASRSLAERVDHVPEGAARRRWVLRDDNQQHYHGIVRLSESPLFVELLWKSSSRGREQEVGRYRLDLAELLAQGFVRHERESASGDEVRLRFYRGDRGVVFIQSHADGPALAIGTVDLAS
jgi:uncharacterized protein YndB with AHSA1/START domain